jgi:hypothetical protein
VDFLKKDIDWNLLLPDELDELKSWSLGLALCMPCGRLPCETTGDETGRHWEVKKKFTRVAWRCFARLDRHFPARTAESELAPGRQSREGRPELYSWSSGIGSWKSRRRFRELHACIGCSPIAELRRVSSCGPGENTRWPLVEGGRKTDLATPIRREAERRQV